MVKLIWLDFHRALVICFLTYTKLIIALPFVNELMSHLEASKPYDGKQGWLKNKNNLLKRIWQVGPSFLSA